MKILLLPALSMVWLANINAQTYCFYDPNDGPIYHNSSQAIYDITTGDFNSDGHLDIVTANSTGANISFIPGYGDGTLGDPDTIAVPAVLFCITSGDFNGDDHLDIATANSAAIFVLFGIGDGTFQPYTAYPAGGSPSRIYSKDLNNDAIPDLIEACDNGIFVLTGQSNGSFLPSVPYTTGGSVIDLTMADFDGDFILDMVSTTRISWTVSILSFLKGNGDGTFNALTATPVPHYSIFGINSADVDSDGLTDLIVSNHNNMVHRMEIYTGNGDGTFNSPVFYPVFYNPNYVYLADLNDDSIQEIIVPEGSGYSILTGKSDGTFDDFQYFLAAPTPNALAIGDYNEDGKPDFMNPSGSLGYITVNLNCTATGVENVFHNENFGMKIFPNPCNTFATIQFKTDLSKADLEIVNVFGQKIKTIEHISGKEFQLECFDLPGGIYFITLRQNNQVIAMDKLTVAE